jgi:hypothetical protein
MSVLAGGAAEIYPPHWAGDPTSTSVREARRGGRRMAF